MIVFEILCITLRNLSRFVVPAEDGYPMRIANFECYQERDGLNRIIPTINVVAHKEVICIGSFATDSKLHVIFRQNAHFSVLVSSFFD